MTTFAQALRGILNANGTPYFQAVFDVAPVDVPAEPYAIVSDLPGTPVAGRVYFAPLPNRARRHSTHVVQISMYAREGDRPSALNNAVQHVKQLETRVTRHPGAGSGVLAGVMLGAFFPPDVPGNLRRPFAAVRFQITYRE